MDSKKMISDILAMASKPGHDGNTYIVVSTVDSIYPHTGWCYATCSSCSKKIHSIGGLFLCTICNAPCRYPIIRYSINIGVNDHTGRAMFTMFNRHAEKLLNSAANNFYNHLDPAQPPPPLIALVGRHFAFKIRMPDYANQDTDFHNFRVVAMYEIDKPQEERRCHIVQPNVHGPTKPVLPNAKYPWKPVELTATGGSTSERAADIGVYKPSDNNKRRKDE